jgi:heterodisulfide reductase subunit A-like polyferredoxin
MRRRSLKKGTFKQYAQVNPVLCKGCGLCVASYRSGEIRLKGFDNEQIFAQIFCVKHGRIAH